MPSYNAAGEGYASPFGGYRTPAQEAAAQAAEEERKRQQAEAIAQQQRNVQAARLGEEITPLIQQVQQQHNLNEANSFYQENQPLIQSTHNAHEAGLFAVEALPQVTSIFGKHNELEAEKFGAEMAPKVSAIGDLFGSGVRATATPVGPPPTTTGLLPEQQAFIDRTQQFVDEGGGNYNFQNPMNRGAAGEIVTDSMIPAFTPEQISGVVNRIPGAESIGAGEAAGRVLSPLTNPAAITATLMTAGIAGPAIAASTTGYGAGGAIGGSMVGKGLEEAGVPVVDTPIGGVGPRGVMEVGGGFLSGNPLTRAKPGEALAGALAPDVAPEMRIATAAGSGGMPPEFQGLPLAGGAIDSGERATEASLVDAFTQAAPKSTEAWAKQMEQWRVIRGERTADFATQRDLLISQGIAPQDAMLLARDQLKGKMPVLKGAFGVDFSPNQEALFWDRALTRLQEFEQTNIAKAFQRVTMTDEEAAAVRAAGGDATQNFKPFEWNLIEKVMGRTFRETAEASQAVKQTAKMAKPVAPFTGVGAGEPMDLGSMLTRAQAEQPGMNILPGAMEGTSRYPAHAPTWGPGEPVDLGSALTRAQPQQAEIPLGLPSQMEAQGTHGPPFMWESDRSPFTPQLGEKPLQIPTGMEPRTPTLPGINAPASTAAEVLPAKTPHIIDIIADSLGLPRAIMSSGDLSVPRQLEKTIGRHPLITAGAMKAQVKAAGSEAYAVEHIAQLRAEGTNGVGYMQVIKTPDGATREIPLGQLLENRYMAVPGTPEYATAGVMSRPEFFVSRFASKLPIVRQSGRAFATGWNAQMQGVNRYWLQKFTKMNGGALTSKQVDSVLNLTDRLLGKGALGKGNWFSEAVKALGFAPGYRVSGPQAWATLLSPTTNNQVRRMAAEELLTWATLGNSILTVAKYGAGATVAMELGNTQFGRIKFPGSDTYYNIWGTDNVLARTILQAIAAKKIDTQGNVTKLGNQKGGVTGFLTAARDATWQYLRSGEDPIVGLITDISAGETYVGEPLKWDAKSAGKMVADRAPMILQDLYAVGATDGPVQSLITAPYAALGGGLTSYEPTGEQFKAIPTYNTASIDATRKYLPTAPEPLNLTANEEREIRDFIGRYGPVQQWKQQQEAEYGPAPDGVTQDTIIKKVAADEGLTPRMTAAALWMYHASDDLTAYNPAWVQFALTNEAALKDRFPGTFQLHAMDVFRQNARKQGLIP